MNSSLLIVFLEIIVLYFLSQEIHRVFSALFYKITHSKKLTIWLSSVLLLPGTYLHEIAHLVVARALFVPAGKLMLIAEYEDNYVKMGSVTIAKTDFIRRYVIGMAPLIFGLTFLVIIPKYIVGNSASWRAYALSGYLIFGIANTMYPSKKDVGTTGRLFGFPIVFAALYLLQYFWGTFDSLIWFLIVPIIINLVILLVVGRR